MSEEIIHIEYDDEERELANLVPVESAAKIAELEGKLSEAQSAHGKTLLLLNTAAFETIPELERRCLIAERALSDHTSQFCVEAWKSQSEYDLVAEGTIPQREVSNG